MSTTPSAAHQQFSPSAPVSLTERRKAETRMEIARAAGALFVRQGLRATRAEDIAQAAGIAPRTFYRYFATKEEAVAPLYAAGAQRWAEAVRAAPAHLSVPEALEHAVHQTLIPGLGVSSASWEWVRTLIRLADTSPALRKVWAEVCQTSETTLVEILAARGEDRPTRYEGREASGEGRASRGDGSEASSVGRASRGEDLTARPTPTGSDRTPTGSDRTPTGSDRAPAGSDRASAELDPMPAGSAPPPAGPTSLTPDLRFTAAVAGAAVRVAVESWAATAAPPTGPEGPAALALRNLGALKGFDWGGEG
ncbi:TetR/AcrR family transcriptional regulator [Streptomyces camelliae]|uniref:TetR family transcriptional regulator n=1 Tax=Streptomyces camelliae TaxID=3004093 RepID=A0ABY7P8S9_9ACTN|nr:TetR/AcrR family transcriptional regulator [Streptomyces sp. HUAS 2-6]WBO65728.1 TetR family transcriptional regulator [Streptomyces sp. HUAS 2-6]